MGDVQARPKEQQAEEKRAARFDYEHTAFMLKKPYHDGIYKGPLRLKDKAAHRRLIEIAKRHGLYVWYASVKHIEKDGRQIPHAVGCHLIDWDSVPDNPAAGAGGAAEAGGGLDSKTHVDAARARTGPTSELICDVCGKKCTSASGLTLHKKTHA